MGDWWLPEVKLLALLLGICNGLADLCLQFSNLGLKLLLFGPFNKELVWDEMPDQENYFRKKLVSYKFEALIDCSTAKKDNEKSSAK